MLSRVAENLYWAARYLERADNLARLTSINQMLLLDLPKGVSPGWSPLLDIVACREAFETHFKLDNETNVVKFLCIDKRNPASIINAVEAARDNLRSVREVIPRHVWQLVNSLHLYVQENKELVLSKRERYRFLEQVTNSVLTIFGALDATMNHNIGYTFVRIGMYIERADMTSRIIDVRSASLLNEDAQPFDNIQWISVLRSLSGYQMYRMAKGVKIRRSHVLQFVLKEEDFPRSIGFCLGRILHFGQRMMINEDLEKRLSYSLEQLHQQNEEKLSGISMHNYIDQLQVDLGEIHSLLAEQFFVMPLQIEKSINQIAQDVNPLVNYRA